MRKEKKNRTKIYSINCAYIKSLTITDRRKASHVRLRSYYVKQMHNQIYIDMEKFSNMIIEKFM